MPGVAIVTGSARGDGNTRAMVDALLERIGADATAFDVSDSRIEPFDYTAHDHADGFRAIVAAMAQSKHVVFATPVYWYAMSGPLKTFFDRLTDLVMPPENRLLGRSLAGRRVWLLATGTDETLPPGFAEPFVRTARYFDMEWGDVAYCRACGEDRLADRALDPVWELAERIGRGD
ncbi:MAG: NAD(P)H-dependent oxidoreductase [Erythrobacter sp.]|nr:NAD(P)H-dependent oxidoreductase [Erythrobacter sp.]